MPWSERPNIVTFVRSKWDVYGILACLGFRFSDSINNHCTKPYLSEHWANIVFEIPMECILWLLHIHKPSAVLFKCFYIIPNKIEHDQFPESWSKRWDDVNIPQETIFYALFLIRPVAAGKSVKNLFKTPKPNRNTQTLYCNEWALMWISA